jgi:hypothetical protein
MTGLVIAPDTTFQASGKRAMAIYRQLMMSSRSYLFESEEVYANRRLFVSKGLHTHAMFPYTTGPTNKKNGLPDSRNPPPEKRNPIARILLRVGF